jgi:hypothetical protein
VLSVVIRRVSQRIMEDKATTDSSMLQKQIGSWIKKENKIHESYVLSSEKSRFALLTGRRPVFFGSLQQRGG